MTANRAYRKLLDALLSSDAKLAIPRDQATNELIGCMTSVDMLTPIVTIPSRELDYQFMAAEACWILRGSRELDHTALARNLSKYSDDKLTMRGAYGPPFRQQVEYVCDVLRSDSESRQAVVTLWERNPRPSRDIPCTVSLQWLIREDKLHCNAFMRSSDAWLGWPYDVFNFSMMSLYVLKCLGAKLQLGTLRIFAGSQHLYTKNIVQAQQVLSTNDDGSILVIDIYGFKTPGDLVDALDTLAACSNVSYDFNMRMFKKYLCL